MAIQAISHPKRTKMTAESISAQVALLKLRIKLTMAVDPIIQTMKAINHFIRRVME